MCFGKWRAKKKQIKGENAIDTNSVDVTEMAGHLNTVMVGLKQLNITDESVMKRFEEVQRNIKYFNPTTDKRAQKKDSEISSLIKDMKADIEIALVKGEDITEKILLKLVKIEMAIPERKTYSE